MSLVPLIAAGLFAAFPLEEVPILQLQQQMQAGTLTARALTEAYLARIQELDPKLHSVLEVNPDALQIADELDRERAAKGPRGPLHGIPVLIKDNIATADKMQTTAGSLALVGARATRDSFVAQRLRAAGAIILGKTNLSEWANIRSPHSSSGWSGRGGQTRNPYALDRTPCGSSSGTGAAIAASFAAVGVGTETDGSIVCPSAASALAGIKPTVGLVSRAGIIPISHTQDTAGPMARTVADAAVLLTVLAGADPDDKATADARPADYTKSLRTGALRGARIGVLRGKTAGLSLAADRALAAALKVMKEQGATLIDPADLPPASECNGAELEVLLTELKTGLAAYLESYAPGAPFKEVQGLIAWNRAHQADELSWFGQERLELAASKGSLTSPEYKQALAKCAGARQGLDELFAAQKLDALVAPTGGPPWLIDPIGGDHFVMSSSATAAVAGTPAITVPALFEHGLPLGVTFMGKAWSEARLIELAYSFEQAAHVRRPPRFLTTAE